MLQSSAPKPDEACVQEVHPEIAVPQNSFANCAEQAPAQYRPDVLTNVKMSANISHISPATPPPKPAATSMQLGAQDTQQEAQLQYNGNTAASTPRHSTRSSSGYSTPTPMDKLNTSTISSSPSLSTHLTSTETDRNSLGRSNSLPAASSSPSATPASSITFLNTPHHSLTSPFPTPLTFRQTTHKYIGSNKNYQNALADNLQDEESQNQNTEWAALVQWITSAHRAEILKLHQNHAAELEQLSKDQTQLRGQLEMRSRERETSVEATTEESEEGVLLGCVYTKVVLGFKGLAYLLRRPETFY